MCDIEIEELLQVGQLPADARATRHAAERHCPKVGPVHGSSTPLAGRYRTEARFDVPAIAVSDLRQPTACDLAILGQRQTRRRPQTGSNGGRQRPSHNRGPSCMGCVACTHRHPGGHAAETNPGPASPPRAFPQITSASLGWSCGDSNPGPSHCEGVPGPSGYWSMRCMSCELTARALRFCRRGAPGGHALLQRSSVLLEVFLGLTNPSCTGWLMDVRTCAHPQARRGG